MPRLLSLTATLLPATALVVVSACARDGAVDGPGQDKPGVLDADHAEEDTNGSKGDAGRSDAGDAASDVADDLADAVDDPITEDVPLPDVVEPDTAPGCRPGEHDGGGGLCVPEGSCEAGYVLAPDATCVPAPRCEMGEVLLYLDTDGDGHGDPASEPICHPLDADPPPGRVPSADDCDDGDGLRWRNVLLWPDQDGDAWTVSRGTLHCIGESIPEDLREARHVPGERSFPPLGASALPPSSPDNMWNEGEWNKLQDTSRNGVRCPLRRDPEGIPASCGALTLSDFGLLVPEDAVIVGIEVRLWRRADNGIEIRDTSVRLVQGERMSPADMANPSPWFNGWEELRYGGPDALWGRAWSPSDVNRPDFGVFFDFSATFERTDLPENGAGRFDFSSLEVYLASSGDCDDTNPQSFRTMRGFIDGDQDGYGSAQVSICTNDGTGLSNSFARHSGDCDDTDDNTWPGQTRFFDTARSDGTFDYDCDGVDEAEPVEDHLTCTSSCDANEVRFVEPPAACGQENTVRRCTGTQFECALPTRTVRTRCR